MWFFRDMLHSTKSTNFSRIYLFYIIDKIAARAGFGPRAVVRRPLGYRNTTVCVMLSHAAVIQERKSAKRTHKNLAEECSGWTSFDPRRSPSAVEPVCTRAFAARERFPKRFWFGSAVDAAQTLERKSAGHVWRQSASRTHVSERSVSLKRLCTSGNCGKVTVIK